MNLCTPSLTLRLSTRAFLGTDLVYAAAILERNKRKKGEIFCEVFVKFIFVTLNADNVRDSVQHAHTCPCTCTIHMHLNRPGSCCTTFGRRGSIAKAKLFMVQHCTKSIKLEKTTSMRTPEYTALSCKKKWHYTSELFCPLTHCTTTQRGHHPP